MAKSLGTPSVTIFSNGPPPTSPAVTEAIAMAKASGCIVDERKVARLSKAGEGVDVVFEDGDKINVGFLFHKPYTDVRARSVIEGLGVEIIEDPSGALVKRTEPFGESNVKGVFVVGDIGTPFKQVTAAMATGVTAIAGLTMQLFTEEGRQALAAANASG
jgi:thioredoxin reductase